MTPNIRKVLVTGAAGSIGAEVCRVLVDAGVSVIGLDQAETPLFWLDKELENAGDFKAVVGSVTDGRLVNSLMRHGPQVVVHAAALKHVGMCERNVCEAVKTNLGGTIVVSKAAKRYGSRIVLVSTDKAVKPTTVMGATKAAAERWLWGQEDAQIVRLVNVWGSAGSLVPVIEEQARSGGPITITDWRMSRMFMRTADAAKLIGDAVFAPRRYLMHGSSLWLPSVMETRNIASVIEQVVRSLGINPETIPVVEVGAGPTEKLAEELTYRGEPTFRQKRHGAGWYWHRAAETIVSLCNDRRAATVRRHLFDLVRIE